MATFPPVESLASDEATPFLITPLVRFTSLNPLPGPAADGTVAASTLAEGGAAKTCFWLGVGVGYNAAPRWVAVEARD